jgi:hypothetical protein
MSRLPLRLARVGSPGGHQIQSASRVGGFVDIC